MSGICGILDFQGHELSRDLLTGMTDLMHYRGLDDTGHWLDGAICLGQATTHTTSQSRELALPLQHHSAPFTLIMDGRVDNWEALRKKLILKGAKLRTSSDAELVLEAYAHWGQNCFQHIDGEFAIAIWDASKAILVCGRDRSSKKPFYYNNGNGHFTFASDMRSLLSLPWIDETLNLGFMAERLADDIIRLSVSCWLNILRLPQGHYMVVSGRKLSIERYWFPENLPPIRYKKQQDYVDHYREILCDTVRRLSRSDRPLSYEVSGGLDSTALFAIADHHDRAGVLLAPDLQGFTLDFHNQGKADELEYVTAAARHLKRQIMPVKPAYQSLQDVKDFWSEHKTLPIAPNGYMHANLYNAASNGYSRVVICGQGGDEWLAGVGNHLLTHLFEGNWLQFRHLLDVEIKKKGRQAVFWNMLKSAIAKCLPNPVKDFILSQIILPRDPYFRDQILSGPMEKRFANQIEKGEREGELLSRSKYKMGTLFNPYIRFANETMEHFAATYGIELRCPFDTQPIIEFSLSIPDSRKKRTRLNRDIHRQAMSDVLPKQILIRDNKADFSATYDYYVRDLLQPNQWHDKIVNEDWVDEKKFTALLKRFNDKAENMSDAFIVWSLYAGVTCLMHD